MPAETAAAARWVYSTLTGDSLITSAVADRVFAYRVPAGAAFPAIAFSFTAQQDTRVADGRVLARLTLNVQAVNESDDLSSLRDLAGRIDVLLEGASGQNVDGVVGFCARQKPIEFIERTDQGREFAHLGGLYDLVVQ